MREEILPQSTAAEAEFLKAIATSQGDLFDEAFAFVPDNAFAVPGNAVIYRELKAMHGDRKPIECQIFTQWLRDRKLLEDAGGIITITDLFAGKPAAWRYYGETVLEKHALRQTIETCRAIERRCFQEQDQVPEIVRDAVTRMLDIQTGQVEDNAVQHVAKYAAKALIEIEYAYDNRGGTVGVSTGFVDLDRMIGGWQKGYSYYFGARPAMGKTSLGLEFGAECSLAAHWDGCPVLIFSVEMTGVQLTKRLICSRAEINLQRGRDGFLSKERDFEKLSLACNKIAEARLYVDETAALTILDFRSRVRRWLKMIRKKYGVRTDGKPEGLVIIDYLQRMKGSSKRAEDARYLELQEIAQGISQTAKETALPIVVLAQLKRPKDKKPDTEPDMTEFRECGDIEQEAHVVGLIHRPHYYVKHNEEKARALAEKMEEEMKQRARYAGKNADKVRFDLEDLKRYAKLIIDKQREGPVGPIDLRFISDYTRFENWDPNAKLFSNNPQQRQTPEVPQE